MRQRGISLDHLERLWDLGALHHRSGGQAFYFDRAARRLPEHDGGESGGGRDDKAFGIYAVIDGVIVVTVGHRYRNLMLHWACRGAGHPPRRQAGVDSPARKCTI